MIKIDFSKKLPKKFRVFTHKCGRSELPDDAHHTLAKEGRMRYIGMYEGSQVVVVNHGGLGWKIYDQNANDISASLKEHTTNLLFSLLPSKTMFLGMLNKSDNTIQLNDVLYYDGECFFDKSWDERLTYLADQQIFNRKHFVAPMLLANVKAKNWEEGIQQYKLDSMIALDGTATLNGDAISLNSVAPISPVHWIFEAQKKEKCVAYALCDDMLLLKQYLVKNRRWFNVAQIKASEIEDLDQLCKDYSVLSIEQNDPYHRERLNTNYGFVVTVSYHSRTSSTGKLVDTKFVSIDRDAAISSCYI